jgi:hypothetical protein
MLAAMELAVTAVPEDAIDPLVAVTARAFVDEQLLRWPLGDHPDPLAVMEAEFRGLHSAAARLGCLWQAGDAAGVASWISPDAAGSFWEQLMSRATSSSGTGCSAAIPTSLTGRSTRSLSIRPCGGAASAAC